MSRVSSVGVGGVLLEKSPAQAQSPVTDVPPARSWLMFVWPLVAVGLSIGAWSVSTPLGAGPDEPAHVIQATAVVRGQFDGRQATLNWGQFQIGREGLVRVPAWVVDVPGTAVPACLDRTSAGTPGCLLIPIFRNGVPRNWVHSGSVLTGTQFSKNPPLYYAIVGVPSLVATGSGAQYGMRYTGAVLDFLLVALGLFLLARYHPRRLTLFGAMVALSPMVLYVSSVVSSSGLETAAGFAAWCGGLCVAARPETPRLLAVLTSVAFVALILSRPLSPINAAVIIVVLAVSVGWVRSRRLLLAPGNRPIWASVVVSTAITGVFLLAVGIPSVLGSGVKPPLSLFRSVWLTLHSTPHRLRDLVGDLVWGRVYAPTWVVVLWVVLLVGLFAYGLVSSRRFRYALPLLIVAIVAMPVVFESPQINTAGPYWQARYWLPLAVGLPLLASAVRPRAKTARWSRVSSPTAQIAALGVAGVLLVVAQVASFLAALHYYERLHPVAWTPPGGTPLVLCLFIAGQVLLLGFVMWHARGSSWSGLQRSPGLEVATTN